MKAKSKRKWNWLRYRKDDHAHNLMVAAQRYIHANGGTAVVLGGIGIMGDPLAYNYSLVIRATGKRPSFKVKSPAL